MSDRRPSGLSWRLRRGLQNSLVDNSTAFGFSITITASFGVLGALHGSADVSEVFGFAIAGALAFTLLQMLATRDFRERPDAAPRKVVMLGTALNFVSVAAAVGVAALVGLILPAAVAWPLGPFLASVTYVAVEAAELALAARLVDSRDDGRDGEG